MNMLSSGVYQTGLAIHTITQAVFTGLMGGESEGFIPSKKEAKTHRGRYTHHPRPSSPATTPVEVPHVGHVVLHKKEKEQGALSKTAQRVKEGVEAHLPSRGKGKPADLPALLIPGAMVTQAETEERPAEQQPSKSEEGVQTKLPSARETQGEKEGGQQQKTDRGVVGEKKEGLMLPKEREGRDEYEEGKPSALSPFEEQPSESMTMPGPKEEEHFMTPPEIRPASSSSRLGSLRKRHAPIGGPPEIDPNTKQVKCSLM